MPADTKRTLRGALAGGVAAGIWAAQQPLDKRIFAVPYDDTELLGRAVVRGDGRAWIPAGVAWHVANGAVFGAVYTRVSGSLPGPGWARGAAAGLAEHLATWPGTQFVGAWHPEAKRFPQLWGSHRAFAQATWRHLLFGVLLGALEERLNPADHSEPPAPEDLAATNGHGDAEHLVAVTRA